MIEDNVDEMTDAEKLMDCQKENAALRDAIADAWQAYSRREAVLTSAREQLSAALAEVAHWQEVATGL